jgi:threonine dehydrogenase-like Zn-dependent dehydrogenase
LSGDWSQCGGPIGGWKFGNSINGAQAEYLLVPHAQANLAKIPDDLSDEQVVLLADIASTGISAAESGEVKIGDSVAVFAQGPIGLCATAGAKLKGAGFIIAVESDPVRAEMAKRMGADVVVDHTKTDAVEEIRRLTNGKGVDVAIEALGTQATFESALRVLRAGGTLSAVRRRPRRPQDCHDALRRRQRTDAKADGARSPRPVGFAAAADAHVFPGPDHRGI